MKKMEYCFDKQLQNLAIKRYRYIGFIGNTSLKKIKADDKTTK